jgi:hypothetical protein
MIDLATGLIFQQKFIRANNFIAEANNTDIAKTVTSFNRVGGSFYGLCGLKNWREANIREHEAIWNHALNGLINTNFYTNTPNANAPRGGAQIYYWYNPEGGNNISGLFYANTNDIAAYTITSTISSGLNNVASTSSARRLIPTQETGSYARGVYFAVGTQLNSTNSYYYIPVAGGAARIQP